MLQSIMSPTQPRTHHRGGHRLALGVALAAALGASVARADGAFPDSFSIFAPPDGRLMVGTNFGLLVSDSAIGRWDWICEAETGTNASLYQVGPQASVYAASYTGLRLASGTLCGWSSAGGGLANAAVVDVFPDPTNALRVLALARPQNPDQSFGPLGLYPSMDGGQTFGAPLYQAPPNTDLTGVELARSSPTTIYMTMVAVGSPVHPYVLRSTDNGASWQMQDALSGLGPRRPRLAAVDPQDANRLYLRVTDVSAAQNPDVLAISDDGGATFRFPTLPNGDPLQLVYPMTTFLRRASGALIIGVGDGRAPHTLFVSTDQGHTFTPLDGAPHLRAITERDGVLYAAADDIADGYAVAASHDDGASWQPLLTFTQLCGPLGCGDIPSACAGAWDSLRATLNVPEGACPPSDAGTGGTKSTSRCRCGSAGGADVVAGGGLLLLLCFRARRRWS